MSSNPAWHEELIDLFEFAARDHTLLNALLDDLCSRAELEAMARRWQIIKHLYKDTPHHEIANRVGVAIATVTRGSRTLKKPTGGFTSLIRMILTVKRPSRAIQAWRNQLME